MQTESQLFHVSVQHTRIHIKFYYSKAWYLKKIENSGYVVEKYPKKRLRRRILESQKAELPKCHVHYTNTHTNQSLKDKNRYIQNTEFTLTQNIKML